MYYKSVGIPFMETVGLLVGMTFKAFIIAKQNVK